MKKITICFIIVTLVITMQCFGIMAKGRDDISGNEIGSAGVKDQDSIIEPATEVPTTEAPTTEASTTEAPTTEAPRIEEPTTTELPISEDLSPEPEIPEESSPEEESIPENQSSENQSPEPRISETEAPEELTTEASSIQSGSEDRTQTNKELKTTEYKPEDLIAVNKSHNSRIERVDSDSDNIRVYYYAETSSPKTISIKLDDVDLPLDENTSLWAESDCGLNIEVLISTSKTVNQESFNSIKLQLSKLLDKMTLNDKLYIYTASENLIQLGSYTKTDKNKLEEDLKKITLESENVKIYKSIREISEQIIQNDNLSPWRNVLVVISDGLSNDNATEDSGMDSTNVSDTLINNYLSMYFIQEKSDYAGKKNTEEQQNQIDSLSEVAIESGGEIFNFVDYPFEEVISALYSKVSSCYLVTSPIDKYNCKYSDYHSLTVTYSAEGKERKLESVTTPVRGLMPDMEVKSFAKNAEHYEITTSDAVDDLEAEETINSQKTREDEESDSFESKYYYALLLMGILSICFLAVILILVRYIRKNKEYRKDDIVSAEKSNVLEANKLSEKNVTLETEVYNNTDAINDNLTESRESISNIPNGDLDSQSGILADTTPTTTVVRHLRIEIRYKDKVRREIFSLYGSAIFGKAGYSDIVINDETMSDQHFVISEETDGIYIQDLETRNGTYVNGERLNQVRKLKLDDRIMVGYTEILIRW